MSDINGVDLIIHDLETTKLGFTSGTLHGNITVGDDGFEEKCVYCGAGVLAVKSGINKARLLNMHTLAGIKNFDRNEMKLFKRYGIHLLDIYPNHKAIECPKCVDSDFFSIRSLELLITHINDVHSNSHKELAQSLRELNTIYDLATGEKR